MATEIQLRPQFHHSLCWADRGLSHHRPVCWAALWWMTAVGQATTSKHSSRTQAPPTQNTEDLRLHRKESPVLKPMSTCLAGQSWPAQTCAIIKVLVEAKYRAQVHCGAKGHVCQHPVTGCLAQAPPGQVLVLCRRERKQPHFQLHVPLLSTAPGESRLLQDVAAVCQLST